MKWASKSFDDSGWKEIIPGTVWEKQGDIGYDGCILTKISIQI